ncbi:MAG: iron-sulfur cluster insertion protein ErpA [Gammaproteobacteria bacterium]|nr:iron-sulfur cluster insertion protein ErpA [Gammaproteobacteria bacterium]
MLQFEAEESIKISSHAARKAYELALAQGRPDASLRVYIEGGGCSGFQYGFKFDAAAEDDSIIECDGMKVVVDPLSLQYLGGAELDYREDLQGSRFVINNPNAQTTCGCGSSFSI